jgi:hypothetical protein
MSSSVKARPRSSFAGLAKATLKYGQQRRAVSQIQACRCLLDSCKHNTGLPSRTAQSTVEALFKTAYQGDSKPKSEALGLPVARSLTHDFSKCLLLLSLWLQNTFASSPWKRESLRDFQVFPLADPLSSVFIALPRQPRRNKSSESQARVLKSMWSIFKRMQRL